MLYKGAITLQNTDNKSKTWPASLFNIQCTMSCGKKGITLTAAFSTCCYLSGAYCVTRAPCYELNYVLWNFTGETVILTVCTHCCHCSQRTLGATTVCQLNVAWQRRAPVTFRSLSLMWAILVDFYQVSHSSSPAGARAAFRMLPLGHQNIWHIEFSTEVEVRDDDGSWGLWSLIQMYESLTVDVDSPNISLFSLSLVNAI